MSKRLILILVAAMVAGAEAGVAADAGQQDRRAELDRQYAALEADLARRDHIAALAHEAYHPEALIAEGDRDPADVVIRRTAALLADIGAMRDAPELAAFAARLKQLQAKSRSVGLENVAARRLLYDQACGLRREIAFSNPLLDFDRLLFLKRHRASFNHMCDQYYGVNAVPGGGLFVLEDPFGDQPRVRDLLAGAVVERGNALTPPLSQGEREPSGSALTPPRSQGERGLSGSRPHDTAPTRLAGTRLEGGSFLSPDLSYDGKQVLFAYVECTGSAEQDFHTDPTRGHWDIGRSYHLFSVNTDGSGLQQLTDGTWNDFDPCWMPNGRVAFISERRGGYLRCGRECPTYTLYDMAADGSSIRCLSPHETNEWHPSVTNDGRIIYTRWDYVDRHGCVSHMPWTTTPDGRDARAVHGNFAPRELRADMELDVRAIPASPRFVATGAPHHGQAFGSLVVFDPRIVDDDAMGPARRLTPEVDFPETQGGAQAYGTPWPLSETYFLCAYDAEMAPGAGLQNKAYLRGDYGLYLVDAFGNKELLYRDPEIASQNPIPLRARPTPPTLPDLPSRVPQGVDAEATLAVMNVYDSLMPFPEGTRITALRIFQIIPMSVPSGEPPHEVGMRLPGLEGSDSVILARYVLGTVPVEADGSAYFSVPAMKELFFQALDAEGLAVQSMRSATYLQPGEHLSCQGCHEPRQVVPIPMAGTPMALQRAPSRPKPDADGTNPFSYPRLVQPVLDRNCVACHEENK